MFSKYKQKKIVKKEAEEKVKFSPDPQPNSNRTKKRKARGFVSLSRSCRKHRRALDRLARACTFKGVLHEPGAPVEMTFTERAGGALNYH